VRTTITLGGIDVPCFELGQGEPRISIIGGIHGCEYSSIAAVTRLMRELEHEHLAGTVTGVPVVSMQSFTERSPFVVPEDGKNLNRAFPGDPGGTYTERLAHDIFTRLIEPATAVLDLHGGDLVEALEPFALFHGEARDLALAFNLPYVVDSTGALEGSTSGAASAAGTLGVIAEAGGIGQLTDDAVTLLADGARNALRLLNVLEGDPTPSTSTVVNRFEWLYSEPGGFWVADVKTGQAVEAGAKLGEVRDLYGDVEQTIEAPVDGVVLFLTTSAAVKANGLLLGLGVGS
jgi:predicted deacylase